MSYGCVMYGSKLKVMLMMKLIGQVEEVDDDKREVLTN